MMHATPPRPDDTSPSETGSATTRPRLIVSGLSGGGGKTIVSLGLARCWAAEGRRVQPFKKGPDYIDAAWLSLAGKRPATNLDPFLFDSDTLLALFEHRANDADRSLIEGNRGLFDGKDIDGVAATSALARTLDAPVILVLDITKMTRTAAAVVAGVKSFEPGLRLAGVVLNRVAGERHRALAAACIERDAGVPVLGAIPKLPENPIPERHMGLYGAEDVEADAVLDALAAVVARHCDVARLSEIAEAAPPLSKASPIRPLVIAQPPRTPKVRIGHPQDAAFWFYYRENLEALEQAGAKLTPLSFLKDTEWPELHGLYIGGGYPELMAAELAANSRVRQRVRAMAELGMPIYAECGGFMYLGEALIVDGQEHPMAGVFPVRTELCGRPQGLGYVEGVAIADTPFLPKGATLRGHEFHYSQCLAGDGSVLNFALRLERGGGILAGLDGLMYKNVWASYTHIHAVSEPAWAERFVEAAKNFRRQTQPQGRRV